MVRRERERERTELATVSINGFSSARVLRSRLSLASVAAMASVMEGEMGERWVRDG